jgi:hypothetical protein
VPALTGAERQARYRARLALEAGTRQRGLDAMPAATPRKPLRGPSLIRRWDDAVAVLAEVRGIYTAWLEALPEATRDTPTGEALQAMADLDLEEIMTIRPPRGFGRD